LRVAGHAVFWVSRPPFPADALIAGLRLGMSQKDAVAALPKLGLAGRADISAATRYTASLSSRYRMVAEFHGDQLHSVSFFVGDVVYPDKRPMVYPAASGSVGAPFRDPNLKLAVLSALLAADAIDLAEPQDLADFVLRRHVDLERDGYHLIRPAYDYLVRYPLTDADLARIETITFDGGEEIYSYCYYHWDGTTNDFDIGSVEGIGRCANLRQFQYISILKAL